jgi:hypothetical protein
MDDFDYTPNPEAIENVYFTQWGDLIFILIRKGYSVFDLCIYLKSTRKEAMCCEIVFWDDCEFFGHGMVLEFMDALSFYQGKLTGKEEKDFQKYVSMAFGTIPSSKAINYSGYSIHFF